MKLLFCILLICPVITYSQSPAKTYSICDGLKQLKDAAETNFMSVINEEYVSTNNYYSSKISIKGYSNNNGFNNENITINTLIDYVTVAGYSFFEDSAAAANSYKKLSKEIGECWNIKGSETMTAKNMNSVWKFAGLKDLLNQTYSVEIMAQVYFNNKLKKWAVSYNVARKK